MVYINICSREFYYRVKKYPNDRNWIKTMNKVVLDDDRICTGYCKKILKLFDGQYRLNYDFELSICRHCMYIRYNCRNHLNFAIKCNSIYTNNNPYDGCRRFTKKISKWTLKIIKDSQENIKNYILLSFCDNWLNYHPDVSDKNEIKIELIPLKYRLSMIYRKYINRLYLKFVDNNHDVHILATKATKLIISIFSIMSSKNTFKQISYYI
jgi:hypothetical protein